MRRPGGPPHRRGEVAPEGFEDFVRAAYAGLVAFGGLVAADSHRGEDLAQVALMKTLAAWRRLYPQGNPEGYARTVMMHLATAAGRRRWRGEVPTDVLPEPAGNSSQEAVEAHLDAQRLLATLPEDQRMVLVLRFWLDYSEQQTAAVLGCSLGTVKSRTSRALARLRLQAAATPPLTGELSTVDLRGPS